MSDRGSSVTLIFYRVGNDWMKGGEPFLNLVAAAAQGSPFTHVEIALGEDEGRGGRMKNVLRVFNDDVGVELAERTGINPSYSYVSIGCSQAQERAMLQFARRQVGKPFSSMGMARSLIWPRKSDGTSWFCAELVAACLQAGGLLSQTALTGAATPSSLYKTYKNSGAVSANPCTLRRQMLSSSASASVASAASAASAAKVGLLNFATRKSHGYVPVSTGGQAPAPPRMAFRQIAVDSQPSSKSSNGMQRLAFVPQTKMLNLSLSSLDMKKR